MKTCYIAPLARLNNYIILISPAATDSIMPQFFQKSKNDKDQQYSNEKKERKIINKS